MASYTVTTNNDFGAGSLREAIGLANANPGSTINFTITGQIEILSSLPDIIADMTIQGPGRDILEITRSVLLGGSRIFTIAASIIAVSITDLKISNGFNDNGAGIFVGQTAVFNLENATVSGNVALLGSGLYVDSNAICNIHNVIFSNNEAVGILDDRTTGNGGGIFVNSNAVLNVNNSIFTGNSAVHYGGGIFTADENIFVNINNTNFNQNSITGSNSGPETGLIGGAGIYSKGYLNINHSVFDNNTSTDSAGAIGSSRVTEAVFPIVNINDTRITNNNVANSGGGILNYTNLTVINCTISGNNCQDGFGGGIENFGPLTIKYSTINNNTVINNDFGTGSGIDNFNTTCDVSNSTFTENIFVSNGTTTFNSIYNVDGTVNIINVTIHNPVNNEGIVNESIDLDTVFNYGNSVVDLITEITPTINDLGGNYVTSVEIPVDPILGPLEDNGGPTLTMAPVIGSPLINAGLLALVNSATDQRGFIRVIDGDVDIGAVEFGSRIICYSGESLVLARNKITKKEGEVKAKDIIAGIHYVYDLRRNKFVAVKHNIITGPTTRYMKIEKDLLGVNQPVVDFFITAGHKVVADGKIMKAKDVPGAVRVKVEPELVYSICTENKTIIQVNGMQVLAWGRNEWLDYSKKNNIRWIDNKSKNMANKEI